jgi:hypothetical protein
MHLGSSRGFSHLMFLFIFHITKDIQPKTMSSAITGAVQKLNLKIVAV